MTAVRSLISKKQAPATLDELRGAVQDAEAVHGKATQEVEAAQAVFFEAGDDAARATLKKARDWCQDCEDDLGRAKHLLTAAEQKAAEEQRAEYQRQHDELSEELQKDNTEALLLQEEIAAWKNIVTIRMQRRANLERRAERHRQIYGLYLKLGGQVNTLRLITDTDPLVFPIREALHAEMGGRPVNHETRLLGRLGNIVGETQ